MSKIIDEDFYLGEVLWMPIYSDGRIIHSLKLKKLGKFIEEIEASNTTAPFCFTQRSFFECFDFRKLKINSLAELQSLHEKGQMFLNSFYTDGYTCRVSFCRKEKPVSSLENVTLTLNSFNSEEFKQFFRPCTVNMNRKDAFTLYHGENDSLFMISKLLEYGGPTISGTKRLSIF
ncbi:uncharacterized protein EV154DRAFT_482430 [Mucor mucedo]|uniref:uncharacterized protein n=1 Tax=Mucor mucedo TaxID=29922 RepID=UPI00221F40D3|nr:uncharacterized protein EV154DRAFT_482430 [Mucor mucedo]KAI7890129.1 hypothetical protein EV154DRAFT_482430 [Mucor mucedo]